MVDTTTTVLAFVKQTVGANRNTWGNILNTNFDLVEEAICGKLLVSTTGGSTTLTQAEARNRFIEVSGTLSSDATIVVPNASKDWIISNATTGDFAVLVKTSGGTATSIPAVTSKGVFCDGFNNVLRNDRAEVGQMAFFGNTAIPNGWWECDGSTKSRAGRGIDLFARISTTWGAGNGATTFGLPDAYTAGKFLRSRTASVALGTAQGDQNKAHTHSGSTASTSLSLTASTSTEGSASNAVTIGSGQGSHQHQAANGTQQIVTFVGSAGGFGGVGSTLTSVVATDLATLPAMSGTTNTSHSHAVNFSGSSASSSVTIASDGGTEARPTNLSAILCIKY